MRWCSSTVLPKFARSLFRSRQGAQRGHLRRMTEQSLALFLPCDARFSNIFPVAALLPRALGESRAPRGAESEEKNKREGFHRELLFVRPLFLGPPCKTQSQSNISLSKARLVQGWHWDSLSSFRAERNGVEESRAELQVGPRISTSLDDETTTPGFRAIVRIEWSRAGNRAVAWLSCNRAFPH